MISKLANRRIAREARVPDVSKITESVHVFICIQLKSKAVRISLLLSDTSKVICQWSHNLWYFKREVHSEEHFNLD